MKTHEDDDSRCYIKTDELKECPFCGSDASLYKINPHTHYFIKGVPDYEGGYFIECSFCDVGISGENEQEIINAWNRRITDD